jgi:hypothetical protein
MGKLHDWAGCGHEYKADELFFAQSRMKCHAISKLAHAGLLVDKDPTYDCNNNIAQPELVQVLHGVTYNYN